MLFWHLGLTSAVVFFTLGRRRIDYRVVLLGAILPDLIDKPLGRLLFEDSFENSRIFAHTLLFSVTLLLAIMLTMRGERSRTWFVLPIATMIHLALDGMWGQPVTLFWPLFGTEFPKLPVANYWLEVIARPLEYPAEGLKEVVGLAALVYLGTGFGLHRPVEFRQFLRTGRLASERESELRRQA